MEERVDNHKRSHHYDLTRKRVLGNSPLLQKCRYLDLTTWNSVEEERGGVDVDTLPDIDFWKNHLQPSSIVFFPGIPELKSKNEMEMKNDYKVKRPPKDVQLFYGPAGHACTCMLRAVVFPAAMYHATVPPAKGIRISLQIQIDTGKDMRSQGPPFWFPEETVAGFVMHSKDPLFEFLKANVEHMLGLAFDHKDSKNNIRVGDTQSPLWENMFIPGNKNAEIDKVAEHFWHLAGESRDVFRRDICKNKLDVSTERFLLVNILRQKYGVVNHHNLKELRFVIVTPTSSLNVHKDTEHVGNASKNSLVYHVNIFRSEDYLPGSVGDGPWTHVLEKRKNDEDGHLAKDDKTPLYVGYLGERKLLVQRKGGKILHGRETLNLPMLPMKRPHSD